MGLRGWNTSETPVAKNAVPLPRGIFDANCSGRSPCTEEKFTPAFSNTLPFSRTRVRPPPPPSRDHPSSRNDIPSKSSTAFVIRSCSSLKYVSVFSRQLIQEALGIIYNYVLMKSDVERYVESARPEFEAKLREWVEIPTIS